MSLVSLIMCATYLIMCATYLIMCATYLIMCATYLIMCATDLIMCATYLLLLHSNMHRRKACGNRYVSRGASPCIVPEATTLCRKPSITYKAQSTMSRHGEAYIWIYLRLTQHSLTSDKVHTLNVLEAYPATSRCSHPIESVHRVHRPCAHTAK